MRLKLTKTTVDGLKPSSKTAFAWDSELRGFGLKVMPSGAKSYVLQYRLGGRGSPARRYHIGQHGKDGWTPDKARTRAEELKRAVKEGKDPQRLKREDAAAVTLRQFAEDAGDKQAKRPPGYLAYAGERKKPRSVTEDSRNLKRHILPVLGDRKLHSISAHDIEKFHASMSATPTTANRCLSLLSNMFTVARKQGLVSFAVNPCRDVEKFPETKRKRFLSQVELQRLGTALTETEAATERHETALAAWRRKGKKGPPPKVPEEGEPASATTAIRLLMLTGCRLSEILTLQWQHVDISERRLRLPESKTGAKIVPLGRAAIEILDNMPKAKESANLYVFPGFRRGTHFSGIQRVFQRIRKRARLHDVRLHDLRHSFASVAVAGGASLYMTGQLLGHAQATTTQRYAHVPADPLLEAADKTAERIAEAMSGKLAPHQKRGDVQKLPRQRT
jgi:integrase